jgi:hypothetical protein
LREFCQAPAEEFASVFRQRGISVGEEFAEFDISRRLAEKKMSTMAVHMDEPRTGRRASVLISELVPSAESLRLDPETPNPDAIHSTEFGPSWIAPAAGFSREKNLHEIRRESPLLSWRRLPCD